MEALSNSGECEVLVHPEEIDTTTDIKKEELQRVENTFKRALNYLKENWKPTLTLTSLAGMVAVAVFTFNMEVIIGLALCTLFFGSWSLYDTLVYNRKIHGIKETIEIYGDLIKGINGVDNKLVVLERDIAVDKSTLLEEGQFTKSKEGIISGYEELVSLINKALQKTKRSSAFRILEHEKSFLLLSMNHTKELFDKEGVNLITAEQQMNKLKEQIQKWRVKICRHVENQEAYLEKFEPSKKQ